MADVLGRTLIFLGGCIIGVAAVRLYNYIRDRLPW